MVRYQEGVDNYWHWLEHIVSFTFESEKNSQLIDYCSVRGRSILCLDEASSSVDEETDQTMQKALRANFADSTMLIVAHRISTIRDVDVVLVMEEVS